MHVADVVLAYLRVLVWPIVLLSFNKEVRKLLGRLRSFSGLGAQAEFDSDTGMVQARKAVEEATTPQPTSEVSSGEDAAPETVVPVLNHITTANMGWMGRDKPSLQVVAEYAQNSPQTTIVSAWQRLDATVRMLHRKLGMPQLPPGAGIVTETAALAAELADRGVLDKQDSILVAVTELAYVRRSVEQRVVTKLEAYDFADTALRVSKLLTDAYERIPTLSNAATP